jgi:hypothetical protein
MRKSFLPIGTALRVTMLAASAAGMTGCAPPILLSASIASHAVAPVPGDTIGEAQDSTTIELRYFRFSPTVSVVGWMDEDTGYGLRGVVRRDGSLVRDHRLYVITYYAPDVRAFPHATVPSGPLKMTGISRDTYHCYFGDKCSPYETFGVRIPDRILRANRDSVAVTFYENEGRKLIVTVRRDLIDAYLKAVDSVSAELRRHG